MRCFFESKRNNNTPLIKFTFLKPGERSLLRQFLYSVKPEKVITETKDESEEEGGDDDFGELDDLDM